MSAFIKNVPFVTMLARVGGEKGYTDFLSCSVQQHPDPIFWVNVVVCTQFLGYVVPVSSSRRLKVFYSFLGASYIESASCPHLWSEVGGLTSKAQSLLHSCIHSKAIKHPICLVDTTSGCCLDDLLMP